MRIGKKWIAGLACVILAAACAAALLCHRDITKQQNEALEALERDAGQYDEYSIILKNTSKAEAQMLAQRYNAQLRITEDGSFACLSLPETLSIRDVYAMDETRAYIGKMSADYKVQISELTEQEQLRLPERPNYPAADEDYGLQTYLDYLNIGTVWESGYTGKGITVAVIDTGIDTDHPEFSGRISEYSYNASEDKVLCDTVLEDGSYDWSVIEDTQGHGTNVTGVLAASMDSGSIIGVAPEVEILVIKVECDSEGRFRRTSDLIFGIYYAIEQDVDVINMSFGVYATKNPFEQATSLAVDSDIICVASAGNDGCDSLMYPAADPNVIGVGALGDAWSLADYSNFGENTDVVAPGSTYTTFIGGGCEMAYGTSLAAPLVSGAVALLRQMEYGAGYDRILELIQASSYDLGTPGRDWTYGFGSVDISALIQGQRGCITYDMLTDELDNTTGVFIRGHALQELPEPERLYAVFDGWYYDSSFTEEYSYYHDKFYDDITLYAKWVNEEDGIPYTYTELADGTIEIQSYTGRRKFITIPEKINDKIVSSIGDHAFAGQRKLQRILLPSGLVNIGQYAFDGCSALTSIEIPDGVTSIGMRAFQSCTMLSSVMLSGNSKLETVGYEAFYGCCSLTKISLPASLKQIDGSAFYNTRSLQSITLGQGNACYQSLDGVLLSADGTTLVAYPAAHGTEYTLPEGVCIIDMYAFACARLSTLDLTGVTAIGEGAFMWSELRSVTIPDSVTKLGANAFSCSHYLSQVTLGTGVEELPASLFEGCNSLKQIQIPGCITEIGEQAFKDSGLQQITFAEDSRLLTIRGFAFYESALTQIDLPASLRTIGTSAFQGTPLTQLTFAEGSSLSAIGMYAFCGCVRLESTTLPETLRTIDDYAFYGSGLTYAVIPASVTELGVGAFSSCTALTRITVDPANPAFKDVDGVVYDLTETALYAYPAGRRDTSYTVLDTAQVIMANGFTGARWLTEINLPDTLTVIGEEAFGNCIALKSITIPDQVTEIDRYAFIYDEALSTISFGDDSSLIRLGYGTFAYSGITDIRIPAGVSAMGQGVFAACDSLETVTFAANSKLESISAYMFDGSSVRVIRFEPGSALKSIQAHGLDGMADLRILDLGDAQLETVDNFAFRFCRSLQDLTLPSSVTDIGRYAFYGCASLSELTVPENVTHIGSYAFLGTNQMEVYFASETMPARLDENWDQDIAGYYSGVTEILETDDYRYAVLNSGSIAIMRYLGTDSSVDLSDLNLGGDITIIGSGAFADTAVTSVVLPDTLTTIQAGAFRYAPLKEILIPASVTFIGREAFAYTAIESLKFAEGSQLSVIEQRAFLKTTQLSQVEIPAAVTTMGTGVFQGSGLTELTFAQGIALTQIPQKAFADTKLQSVSIPDSVVLVDYYAFQNVTTLRSVSFGSSADLYLMGNAFYNTGLEQLYIPQNVTFIGEFCFVGLSSLKEFTVDENNPNYTAVDGLLLTKDGRKLIAVPAGRTGTLTVPKQVEQIGFGAFEDTQLSQVNFHEDANILSLGYRAFFNAKNITAIAIPASVVAIDYYAFGYCENLQEVIFAEDNNLMGIYEGAFCGDIRLKSILLPERITEIADFAFYGCSELADIPVSCPEELLHIGDYAFAYTAMEGVFSLPENVETVGKGAFMGAAIVRAVIPDGNVEKLTLGQGIFEDCRWMEDLTLPFAGRNYADGESGYLGYVFGAGSYMANESYIPESLKSVTFTEGITTLSEGAFYGISDRVTLHIPHSVTMVCEFAFENCGAKYSLSNAVAVASSGTGLTGKLILSNEVSIRSDLFAGAAGLEEVVLPEGIKSIPSSLFENCTGLKRVTIPTSVTYIDENAFAGCTGLEQIDIPAGVTAIGGYAFSGCTALKSITLPEGLVSLGNGTFQDCSSLQSIVIPEGITEIKYATFMFCGSLQKVQLPDGITSIGQYAFLGCSMESFTVPASLTQVANRAFESCNSLYEVKNNSDLPLTLGSPEYGYLAYCAKVLTDKDGNKTYRQEGTKTDYLETADGFRYRIEDGQYTLIEYLGTQERITLPDSVEGQTYTIRNFRGGKHIVIPETFTQIPEYAFMGNDTIVSVTIPGTVTAIGNNAFTSCTALEDVTLNEGLITVGNSSFMGCSALQEITLPDSVRILDNYAFNSCISLKTVTLGAGLYHMGSDVFTGCNALQTVELSRENTRFVLKDRILYNKEMTEIVAALPGVSGTLVLPDTLTVIGDSALSDCTGLTKVLIPDGVTSIGYSAFSGCTGLTELVIPESVTSIGHFAFSGCTSLASVTLPENLSVLESSLFYGCSSLTGINIPAGVTQIGGSAFAHSGLVSIRLPEGLETLSWSIFDGCSDLRYVELPEGLTTIGGWAFRNCTALETVELPETVTTIRELAFQGATSLKHITIPDSVVTIESKPFDGCSGLQTVTLGNGITEIGNEMFRGLSGLKTVELGSNVTAIGSYAFAESGLESIVIPDSVLTIDQYAFYQCTSLQSAVIGNAVKTIGDSAFCNCSALKTVSMGSGLKSIDRMAFSNCMQLEEVHLTDLAAWCAVSLYWPNSNPMSNGASVYLNGSLVTDLVIPDTVTSIGQWAFYDCNSIKTVTIGDQVETIGSGAFSNCPNLADVKLPVGLETLSSAFSYCPSLKSIQIPDSVTTISRYALAGCDCLTSITIPAGVTTIEEGAFEDCTKLYEIYNNSNLTLTMGAADNGYVARYAKVIVDKNGNRTYLDPAAGFRFVDTADGFRFVYENGEYTLVVYTGMEEAVTLPDSVDGQEYTIREFRGAKHVTVPSSIKTIHEGAFLNCAGLESVVISDGVEAIEYEAFRNCVNLKKVVIGDDVQKIDVSAFDKCGKLEDLTIGKSVAYVASNAFGECTALFANQSYWKDGIMLIDGWLMDVDESLTYLPHIRSIRGVIPEAYDGCYRLKTAVWGGSARGLTNVETLYITRIHPRLENVSNVPAENIVICDCVEAGELSEQVSLLRHIDGVTIFVEMEEEDLRWDVNFPGWSGHNRVIYADRWIELVFYDHNGDILYLAPQKTSEVIRRPVLLQEETDQYSYQFLGWDTDGDGEVDVVPATSVSDISAHAVVVQEVKQYTVTFRDSETDTVYLQEKLPYGSVISLPEVPAQTGKVFLGWQGWYSGMTLNRDVTFTAMWHTHFYSDKVFAPTCIDQGYTLHTCSCGDRYTDTFVNENGHSFETWYVTQQPTCTENGTERRDCLNCTYYETRSVAALGHTEAVDAAVAPTCTATGLTEGKHCSVCGTVIVAQTVVEAIGHDYEAVVNEPTCTEGGYTTYICTVCGDTYASDEVAAKGHTPGEPVRENYMAPTEEAEGGYDEIICCTECGAELERIHVKLDKLPTAEPEWLPGDVNHDGWIDAEDAALIMQYEVGLIGEEALDLTVADVNGDGWCDAEDAALIMQLEVGLIEHF